MSSFSSVMSLKHKTSDNQWLIKWWMSLQWSALRHLKNAFTENVLGLNESYKVLFQNIMSVIFGLLVLQWNTEDFSSSFCFLSVSKQIPVFHAIAFSLGHAHFTCKYKSVTLHKCWCPHTHYHRLYIFRYMLGPKILLIKSTGVYFYCLMYCKDHHYTHKTCYC